MYYNLTPEQIKAYNDAFELAVRETNERTQAEINDMTPFDTVTIEIFKYPCEHWAPCFNAERLNKLTTVKCPNEIDKQDKMFPELTRRVVNDRKNFDCDLIYNNFALKNLERLHLNYANHLRNTFSQNPDLLALHQRYCVIDDVNQFTGVARFLPESAWVGLSHEEIKGRFIAGMCGCWEDLFISKTHEWFLQLGVVRNSINPPDEPYIFYGVNLNYTLGGVSQLYSFTTMDFMGFCYDHQERLGITMKK